MRRRSLILFVAIVAALAPFSAGCSRRVAPDPVSSIDLQNGLAQKLADSGTPTKWVRCPNSLPSQIGATTRCEVTFKNGDSVTAMLTTNHVDNGKTSWEITAAQLTQEQVQQRVSGITGIKKVDCDSGMSGRVGNWVQCRLTKDGMTLDQTAEVAEAKGLSLKVAVTELMPQQSVEDKVQAKLTPLYGRRPDRTECSGALRGIPGTSVVCVATIEDNADNWAVTVTRVVNGDIDFDVSRPSERRPVGGPDSCIGCPG